MIYCELHATKKVRRNEVNITLWSLKSYGEKIKNKKQKIINFLFSFNKKKKIETNASLPK